VVTTGTRKNVLTIPKAAVKREGKKAFTVMQVDGKLVDRPIELGWRDDKVIQVVSGLADGDQVGIPNKPITKKRRGRRPR